MIAVAIAGVVLSIALPLLHWLRDRASVTHDTNS